MKNKHTNDLVKICGNVETMVMNLENMSMKDIDQRLSIIYTALTSVVGKIQMENDNVSGALE